jgi:hypothetical protein
MSVCVPFATRCFKCRIEYVIGRQYSTVQPFGKLSILNAFSSFARCCGASQLEAEVRSKVFKASVYLSNYGMLCLYLIQVGLLTRYYFKYLLKLT